MFFWKRTRLGEKHPVCFVFTAPKMGRDDGPERGNKCGFKPAFFLNGRAAIIPHSIRLRADEI